MKEKRVDIAIRILRWIVGAVVLIQTFMFLFAPQTGHGGQPHLPEAFRLILGWSEAVATALFLIPATLVAGGWSLLLVFIAAILIHLAHGQYSSVGGLLIYGAAVFTVISYHTARQANNAEMR